MRAIPLRSIHRPAIAALLAQAPIVHGFLVDRLHRRGPGNAGLDEWHGAFRSGQLEAMVLLIGRPRSGQSARLGVVAGCAEGCHAIGMNVAARGAVDMLMGPRSACDALWSGMQMPPPAQRINQRHYICRDPSPGPRLQLRMACQADLPRLLDWSAKMTHADLGHDPRAVDPRRHRRVVAARIAEGRTLLGEHNGAPCFALEIGTQRKDSVHVGGTYVPEVLRGRGFGTAGMRGAVHLLRQQSQAVSLHVHETNMPAIQCYVRAGFMPDVPLRLLIR